jgi:hypothetical protein
MLEYNIQVNNGVEAFGTGDQKTITVNEAPKAVSLDFVAEEIHHANELIPKRAVQEVLANFADVAARLMSEGFAIQFVKDGNVVLRLYADMHIKGGNINLARAKELDPAVTEITTENAGDLVTKAGIAIRAKAEVEQTFTDMLLSYKPQLQRKAVVEKQKVERKDGTSTDNTGNGGNTGGGNTGGNGGTDDDNLEG